MSTFVERFQRIEDVGKLWNKGHNYTEIARELGISPAQASALVGEYKEFLRLRSDSDPDFLERITENTLEMLDSLNLVLKEAWESHQRAKDFEMINMEAQTLKLVMDITERKAKLLQLMGAKADGGNVARLNRAERVNEIVAEVIKEVVADCPRCAQLAQIKLAEAFSLMGKEEEGSTMQEYEPEDVIEVAELVEHTHDNEDVLKDIFSED